MLLKTPFRLLNGFLTSFGYPGRRRFVALYWEPAGDESCYDDGGSFACGMCDNGLFLGFVYQPHVVTWLNENGIHLGDSDRGRVTGESRRRCYQAGEGHRVPASWLCVMPERTTEETTMNIFDALHRANFDKLFSVDEEGRQAKAKLLREAGVPEELIEQFCRPGVQVGMTLGGAKTVDVMTLVERVLFHQNAGSVLLRVTRPPYDEAGHVEIAVLEVGPPSEQQVEGEQAGQQGEARATEPPGGDVR